jgi:hypothetical protein
MDGYDDIFDLNFACGLQLDSKIVIIVRENLISLFAKAREMQMKLAWDRNDRTATAELKMKLRRYSEALLEVVLEDEKSHNFRNYFADVMDGLSPKYRLAA